MHSFSLKKYQPKQSCPATLNNSNEVSFQQPSRKFSMADLNNRIDIDQVMVDIKLTPLKSNEFTDKIKTIYACLEWMKRVSPSLLEEVRTAELIVESIEAKWKKHHQETTRLSHVHNQSNIKSILHESTFKPSNKKTQNPLLSKRKSNANIINSNMYTQVSPIKQLDEATSRIVYTNFSIKEIQKSCKKDFSHKKPTPERQTMDNKLSQNKLMLNQSQSTKDIRLQSGSKPKTMHKKDNSVFTVSMFDAQDEEMQRLTKNIKALDRVLEQKGLGLRNQPAKQKGGNKMALKQVTLNTTKHSAFRSDKRGVVFNCKQRSSSANKQNW